MKSMILAICMMGLASVTMSQDIPKSQVPSVVLNALQSKYPNATDLEWELKGDLYKAEFEIGSRDHDLWIDKNGNIKKHKEDFPKADLPAAIREKIAREFKDYRIDDVDKIEVDGKVTFEIELDGRAGDRKVLFSADGSIQQDRAD